MNNLESGDIAYWSSRSAAADMEVERLNRLVDELRSQLRVAESFGRVAIKERDYERHIVAQLQAELNRRV